MKKLNKDTTVAKNEKKLASGDYEIRLLVDWGRGGQRVYLRDYDVDPDISEIMQFASIEDALEHCTDRFGCDYKVDKGDIVPDVETYHLSHGQFSPEVFSIRYFKITE
jgi:endo-alpha-1,4-polygalactosaminidase (GH114 family)